jgi:glycosyltransferase involved in cell wall biosynthesis
MKVAYFTNKYPYVRHTFIRREVQEIEKHGVAVERFSIRRSPDVLDPADIAEQQKTHALREMGLRQLVFGLVRKAFRRPVRFARVLWWATCLGLRSNQGVLRHWAYLAQACLLIERMKALNVDHLHVHFGTNCAAVALFCHLLAGTRYSLTIHGSEEWDRPEALSLQDKYEHAEFVVAVSEYARCQVLRWTDSKYWDRVHVVRCGLDAAFLRAKVEPMPEAPRFVVVAALVEGKGHQLLLEALGLLAAEGRAFELLIAGDGPLRAALEEQASALKIADRVKFLGWRSNEQIREAIVQSRAMVLPSFAENLPVVFMESLALARPVIAPQIAGIPELIEEGVNGWLVPAGSIEGFAGALRQALDAPLEKLSEMGEKGRAKVIKLHDVSREAEKMARLFGIVGPRTEPVQLPPMIGSAEEHYATGPGIAMGEPELAGSRFFGDGRFSSSPATVP